MVVINPSLVLSHRGQVGWVREWMDKPMEQSGVSQKK